MDKNPWLVIQEDSRMTEQKNIVFLSQPKINSQTLYRELDSPKNSVLKHLKENRR